MADEYLKWGNFRYLNLETGQSVQIEGKSIKLQTVQGNSCTLLVEGTSVKLTLSRMNLPVSINGLQLFLAATAPVAAITSDKGFPDTYSSLSGSVQIAVCPAGKPMLDKERYTFPIDRSDGYQWTFDEDSHMFAYLGKDRAHEGIDFNLTGAEGTFKSKLVAIEDSVVRWVSPGATYQACVLLESASQKGIYYIYQHLDRERVHVRKGQSLKMGDSIGHIWGDGRWTHLHFTVIAPPEVPDYSERYQYVLNCFPQLYELWQGSLEVTEPEFERGEFRFATPYWLNGNRQYLSAYSDLVGYGWRLGDWCPASKVERVDRSQKKDVYGREGSAVLRKTLFPGLAAEARNPDDHFDFEVRVPNGRYRIGARCGHAYYETAQSLEIEGIPLGSIELPAGEFATLIEKNVTVHDGYLTLRVELENDQTPAGLAFLSFHPL